MNEFGPEDFRQTNKYLVFSVTEKSDNKKRRPSLQDGLLLMFLI
jgi:hypothetical protein